MCSQSMCLFMFVCMSELMGLAFEEPAKIIYLQHDLFIFINEREYKMYNCSERLFTFVLNN